MRNAFWRSAIVGNSGWLVYAEKINCALLYSFTIFKLMEGFVDESSRHVVNAMRHALGQIRTVLKNFASR